MATTDDTRTMGGSGRGRLERSLDEQQRDGLGDMDPEAFRTAAHAVVDVMADYLACLDSYDVLPNVQPGFLRGALPSSPPEMPEPIGTILDDYVRLVQPNVTHWQHPGFFAYFSSAASGPGVLGEMLTAVLNANSMLWRTSPAGTELEQVVVDWLRQALGFPEGFDGLLTDTASTSSLISLAAAREAAGLHAATDGLAGRADVAPIRVYASAEAHSSIEKACMTIGIGRRGLVRIPVNERFEMKVDELEKAIAADRDAGLRPIAIVATIGTTSTTSVDPVARIADVAEREGLWLHVDAAYAGAVALIPERRRPFEGWERADSVVTNPHKWFFTPVDASLLLTRRLDMLQNAFSLVPEYLRTLDQEGEIRNYNEYTPQLGRRLRALKLWIQLRYFGLEGMRRRIERHLEMAQRLSGWIDADPDFVRMAPAPFSTVCFRCVPEAAGPDEGETAKRLDELNQRLMDAVNATGQAFLSHTRLHGRFTIRLAIGNPRTEDERIARTWALIRAEAGKLD